MIKYKENRFLHDGFRGEAEVVGCFTSIDAREYRDQATSYVLKLNSSCGWDGDTKRVVDELQDFDLKGITIFGNEGVEITSLRRMPQVEYLSVAGFVRGQLDLDSFPYLRYFGLGAELKGKNKIELNWGAGESIEKIQSLASKLPLAVLTTFPKLKHLCAVKVNWDPSELKQLSVLKEIDFSYWNKLVSLDQIADLGLTRLSLHSASKLVDYQAISRMIDLEYFKLEKCQAFPSISLLSSLSKLRALYLIGIKIEDGNLAPLLDLPCLSDIAVMEQKHFRPSADEIWRLITSRNA